jgi:predicted Zn-dependent peptidase
VQPMLDATLNEIEAARNGKLPPDYLQKVKSSERRTFEQSLTSNAFWLSRLVEHSLYGSDPALILQQRALIDALTPESIAEAARRYLDPRRHLVGVLRPRPGPVSARR